MKAAAVRILRTVHAALGRWLAEADKPVIKGKTRARTGNSRRKRGTQHTTDPSRASERKHTSWFDLPPGAIGTSRSADEEEADEWERRHFRINGQPWPGGKS